MDNQKLLYFTSLQKKYPSLANVHIEGSNIVFPNGIISLKEVSLERVPEKYFLMQPEAIFEYLNHRLYELTDANYLHDLTEQIEKNTAMIKKYVEEFKGLCLLRRIDPKLSEDSEFLQDLFQRKNAIEQANKSSIIRSIIKESDNRPVMQNEDNGMNSNVSNANEQTLQGPAIVLQRTNPLYPTTSPISQEIMNEKNQNGGFSSIILVIISTLGFGIYLALSLLK